MRLLKVTTYAIGAVLVMGLAPFLFASSLLGQRSPVILAGLPWITEIAADLLNDRIATKAGLPIAVEDFTAFLDAEGFMVVPGHASALRHAAPCPMEAIVTWDASYVVVYKVTAAIYLSCERSPGVPTY